MSIKNLLKSINFNTTLEKKCYNLTMRVYNRISYIYSNKFTFLSCIFSVLIAATQFYNWIVFDDLFSLIRGVGLILIPIVTFLFYEKGLLIYSSIMATVFLYLTDYNNYTSIWYISACLQASKSNKKTGLIYIWYSLNVLIGLIVMNETIQAAFIHLIFSAYMCVINLHCNAPSKQKADTKLILTPDEEKILYMMVYQGKQQKEITMFSQTTITKKLDQARTRNNIKSTSLLLVRYGIDTENSHV